MIIHGIDLLDDYDMVVKSFVTDGFFEDEAISFWKSHLVEGQIAYDIGCYSGLYGLISDKMGCRSICYEPNPLLVERINLNAKTNSASNGFELRHKAAGSTHASIPLYLKTDTKLTSAGSIIQKEGLNQILVEIEPIPLEGQVCAMKIDVECAEMEVLKGCQSILETWKPALMIECLTPCIENEVFEFLSKYGYEKVQLDKRNFGFVSRVK